jgi:hypothetical protein
MMGIPDPKDPTAVSADRRSLIDRRAKQTSPFSLVSLRGSRKTIRRAEDRSKHLYVDLYGFDESLLFVLILMLSVADAFLTLELVGGGMTEMNYVMYYYMQLGPLPFVLVKYFLTAVGVILLLIHKNYFFFLGLVRVKTILVGLAVMYSTLITYELLLFHQSHYFSTLTLSMTTGLTGTF